MRGLLPGQVVGDQPQVLGRVELAVADQVPGGLPGDGPGQLLRDVAEAVPDGLPGALVETDLDEAEVGVVEQQQVGLVGAGLGPGVVRHAGQV